MLFCLFLLLSLAVNSMILGFLGIGDLFLWGTKPFLLHALRGDIGYNMQFQKVSETSFNVGLIRWKDRSEGYTKRD